MNDLIAPNITREEIGHKTVAYRPSRIEALRTYNINIKFLDRGVTVSVGCKEIAYESVESFTKSFIAYMDDPFSVQKSWLEFFHEQEQKK
jgi:hypothetical protein